MRFSDRRRSGGCDTRVVKCWMGYEPGSTVYARKLLSLRVSTGTSFDAMGPQGDFLFLPAVYGE